MVRIVPTQGRIVRLAEDAEIDRVLEQGCWTPIVTFGARSGSWSARAEREDYSRFHIYFEREHIAELGWELIGQHNAENALAAIVCAEHVGIDPQTACHALAAFKSVKRRLQLLACVNGISVYDDFAHHPTAIAATMSALRANVGAGARIIAVLEPRSNTMRMGVHRDTLASALTSADQVLLYRPAGLSWDLQQSMAVLGDKCGVFDDVELLITKLIADSHQGDHVLIMSNGGFQGIHQKLLDRLSG